MSPPACTVEVLSAGQRGEREPVRGRWFPLTVGSSGASQEPSPPSRGPVSCPRPRPPVSPDGPPRIGCRMGPTSRSGSRPAVLPDGPPRIGCRMGPTRCPKSRPPVPPDSSPPLGDPVPVFGEPPGVSASATPPMRSTAPAETATTRAFGARDFRNLVFSTMSFSPVRDKGPTSASFRNTEVLCSARSHRLLFRHTGRLGHRQPVQLIVGNDTRGHCSVGVTPFAREVVSGNRRRVRSQRAAGLPHTPISLRRRCTPTMNRSGPEVDEKRSVSFTVDGHSVVRSILLLPMI
jgi:hypothetical protein